MDPNADHTSVRVRDETHARLESLKGDRDRSSFDDLLNEMIDSTARVALWRDDGERAEYVDKLTEPLRRECASLEIALDRDGPASFEDRVARLEGKNPDELRTRVQRLSRERLWSVRGNEYLPDEEARDDFLQLDPDEQAEVLDDLAESCMTASEISAARDEGVSPREYVEDHYTLDVRLYPHEDALQSAMSAVRQGPEGLPDRESSSDEESSPTAITGIKDALDNGGN